MNCIMVRGLESHMLFEYAMHVDKFQNYTHTKESILHCASRIRNHYLFLIESYMYEWHFFTCFFLLALYFVCYLLCNNNLTFRN